SRQEPVAVDGRVPVEAAEEGGVKATRRQEGRLVVQDVVELVRVLAVDAREGEAGESGGERGGQFVGREGHEGEPPAAYARATSDARRVRRARNPRPHSGQRSRSPRR